MRYWREKGCPFHNDTSFMELDDLATAPFEIYIIKQQKGDFVLLPPNTLYQFISFVRVNLSPFLFLNVSAKFSSSHCIRNTINKTLEKFFDLITHRMN
jgi:hypothetical protein